MPEGTRGNGKLDSILVFAIATLVAIGLAMIFSASSVSALSETGDGAYYIKRQLVWLAIGAVCAFFAYRIDYRKWRKLAPVALGLSIVSLVIVLVPHVGIVSNGARRWLGAGSFSFEPSELAKLALILYLASALAAKGDKVRSLVHGVAPLLGVTLGLAMLIVRQPDFGTGSLLALTGFVMLYVAGARVAHLGAVLGVVAPFAYLIVRHDPYKWARMTAFVNPWRDPQDTGFHIIQSLLALGSGGLVGRGLGFSDQKLYLPEAYTDFIGAIIGEELGLIGLVVIIALFVTFAYRATRIALGARDRFGFFLAIGASCEIVVQALVNIGVVSSSWPVTGVPLPFISFGGTSLVTSLVLVALVANVGRARGYDRNVERDATPVRPQAPVYAAR